MLADLFASIVTGRERIENHRKIATVCHSWLLGIHPAGDDAGSDVDRSDRNPGGSKYRP